MGLWQQNLRVSCSPRSGAWHGTVIAAAAVVFHVAACGGLGAIAPGIDLAQEMALRQRWVLASAGVWTLTWTFWALSSMSLLALCVAWSMRLCRLTAAARWAIPACGLIAAGLACDLCGEAILIFRATRGDLALGQFAATMHFYELLGPAAANGLYCLGGLLLSTISWRSGWLRGWPGAMGFVMWMVGLGLTAATLVEQRGAMMVTGAGVMGLFIPWAGMMAWRLRPQS